MTSPLSNLDFGLILIYIFICLYLGWRSSVKESSEGFLLADRKLGTFENVATMLASKTGGGMFLTAVTFMYMYGGSVLWAYVGVSLGYLIFLGIATRLRRLSEEKRYYTLSDYYFDKYGPIAGYVTAGAILFGLTLGLLIQLVGGAHILSRLMGWSYELSLVVTCGTILAYIVLGGFKAVVKTDIIQFFSIIVLTTLVAFVLTNGMEVSYSEMEFTALPTKTLIGFFLYGLMYPFASAELWQRAYAGKTVKSVQRSVLVSAVIYLALGLPFMMMGLGIKAKLPPMDSEIALIEGFVQLLPAGVMGVGLVAIFAAIMSSADTTLFTMTSVVLQDFYDRIKKATHHTLSKKALVRIFRGWLAVFMAFGFGCALWLRSIEDAAIIFTGYIPVTALTILISWIWRKMPGYFFVIMIGLGYFGATWTIYREGVTEQLILGGMKWTMIGFVVGLVVYVIRKQLTQKTS